jgi:hypothetical protein
MVQYDDGVGSMLPADVAYMHYSCPVYVCTTPLLLRCISNIDVPSLLGRLETRLNNPDVQGCLLRRDLEDGLISLFDGLGQVLVNGRVVSGDGL